MLLVAAGLLGYFGAHLRSANIENVQLLVSIVGVLLAFHFIGEVKVAVIHQAEAFAMLYVCAAGRNVRIHREL